MRAYPAYTHRDILKMPIRTFYALLEEIDAEDRRQSDAAYFRGQPLLAEEWEENAEEWKRAQGVA